MSKLIATLVASLFAATAFAQTNATPPVQPAAGTTANTTLTTKGGMAADKSTMASDKPMSDAKMKRTAKSKARKMKRDEKVGDKPLN